MDDIYLKTLIMHIAEGLLASQSQDFKYIDTPEKKKEEMLADDCFKYANELMKRFKALK